jgi:hypothetical protein
MTPEVLTGLGEFHQQYVWRTESWCEGCGNTWPCTTARLLDDITALEARTKWLVAVLKGVEWDVKNLCGYCRAARNDKALRDGHQPDCLVWDSLNGGTMHTPAVAVQP